MALKQDHLPCDRRFVLCHFEVKLLLTSKSDLYGLESVENADLYERARLQVCIPSGKIRLHEPIIDIPTRC